MGTLLSVLIAFFLPPISVFINRGIGLQLIINIILCLAFYLPGSLHAIWVMLDTKNKR